MAKKSLAKGSSPRMTAPSLLAALVFAVVTLLTLTSLVNTYLTKVPGFWVAVEFAKQFAQSHFGFFVFLVALAGMAITWVFSRVPELSLSGLKAKNPLHSASSDKDRLAFEQEKRAWETERQTLLQKANTNESLRSEVAALKRQLRALSEANEVAATNMGIYEFALKTCSHQDSVLEKLFLAFNDTDEQFAEVYAQTMNWLANLAKQLVVRQDRTLTCTIMSYDESSDRCQIIGEVGTNPVRANRFSPRKGLGIGGHVIETGDPIIVPNVLRDKRYIPSTKDDPKSLLAVPVFGEGKIIGLVNIRSRPEKSFSETDLKTVQPAIDNIAIAMALARLRAVQHRQARLTQKLDEYLQGTTPMGGEEDDVNQKSGAGGR